MSELTVVPVADESRRRLKIGERGPDGRVFLGNAIVAKMLIFASVSSMKKFDPEHEGCPRRWFYQFREGKKEEKTAAQTGGSDFGKQLESYLKTGIDKMQPVLLPVKHFFPKPGPDLEVEEDLASDIGKVIALRRMLLLKDRPLDTLLNDFADRIQREARMFAGAERSVVEAEIARCARLTAAGVPITGAADVRHRRGEYIDKNGQLRKEDPGMRVVSIDDLKTTKRINDHVTRSGKLIEGWALTDEEVVDDTQMVGYGVHAPVVYPDTTHLRLAHNYAQTANGFVGVRRMGLVTVEHVRRRWAERDEPVLREMTDVAAAAEAHDVPINTKSCRSYGRECPHMSYCQPERTLGDVFDFSQTGDETMSTGDGGNGLFDSIVSGSNGAVAQPAFAPPIPGESLGLFGAPTPTPPPIPVSVMPDDERQRQIDEAKAKLRRHPLEGIDGYTVGQDCNGRGYYQSRRNAESGFIPVEAGHSCKACAQAPALPHVGQVNPLDSPPFDPVAAQKPLAPEEIAKIEDSEIRARAEGVAKAAAEREALTAVANGAVPEKKTGGNCPAGGTTVLLTDKEKFSRQKKCPGCEKQIKIKDKDFTPDFTSMVLPKHRLRTDLPPVVKPAQTQPQQPPAIPQAVPVLPPPLPQSVSPEPPPIPTVRLFIGAGRAGEDGSAEARAGGSIALNVCATCGSVTESGSTGGNTWLAGSTGSVGRVGAASPNISSTICVISPVIRHLMKSVALGLETKESAFDKIAAMLA